jgi:hypothetical protein
MAEDKRRVVLRALPALIRVPPDEVNFLRILIQVVFVIARPPPDQLLDHSFFETTGETPETLLEIVRPLFYAKKSYFLQLRREARKFVGYFV